VIPKLHSWHAPSQAFALVTSPKLGLQQGKKLKKKGEKMQ